MVNETAPENSESPKGISAASPMMSNHGCQVLPPLLGSWHMKPVSGGVQEVAVKSLACIGGPSAIGYE